MLSEPLFTSAVFSFILIFTVWQQLHCKMIPKCYFRLHWEKKPMESWTHKQICHITVTYFICPDVSFLSPSPAHDTGLVTLQVAVSNQIISNSVVFEYKARALPSLPSSQHDWLSLDGTFPLVLSLARLWWLHLLLFTFCFLFSSLYHFVT